MDLKGYFNNIIAITSTNTNKNKEDYINNHNSDEK